MTRSVRSIRRAPKMGIAKTASESILEETVVPSEEANYSLQGSTGKCELIYVLLRAKKTSDGIRCQGHQGHWPFVRSFAQLESDTRIRTACDAAGLKAMWRATHSRATANRCLEIQIYSLRCFHAPVPSGKFNLRRHLTSDYTCKQQLKFAVYNFT